MVYTCNTQVLHLVKSIFTVFNITMQTAFGRAKIVKFYVPIYSYIAKPYFSFPVTYVYIRVHTIMIGHACNEYACTWLSFITCVYIANVIYIAGYSYRLCCTWLVLVIASASDG